MNSISKKKQKETEGTGHGGGVGKRRQGEIVRDFLIRLVMKQMDEKYGGTTSNNVIDTDTDTDTDMDTSMGVIQMDIKDRHVQFLDQEMDETKLNQAIEFLQRGSGIMDVAGGSGFVSLAFSLKGIKSTVIDPRETVGKLPGRDRKALKKAIKNRNGSVPVDNAEQRKVVNILPPPIEFASLRAWFAKRPDGIDVEFREGATTTIAPIPICTMCSPDKLLPTCSAIVALHPDEATGDIVDFAVAHRLPFVVVPCCVFSRLFPMRFKPLKEGDGVNQRELVSTYDDLIAYLVNKDASIRISKLDFDGANLALWSTFPTERR